MTPDDCPPRSPGRPIEIVVLAVLASIIGVTIYGLPASASRFLVLDVVVGVLGLALVPVSFRRPVLGAVLLAALTLVSPAATPSASAGAMVVAQSRPFRVAAVVGVLGVGAQATLAAWRPSGSLSYGWWMALIVVSWTALIGWGTVARVRRELVRSLRERASRAESERDRRVAEARLAERTRIAREMHDVLAHRLSLLATYAGALEYRPDAPPEKLSAAAGVIRSGVHEALEELRAVITVLRDDESDDDGVRPQPGLGDLDRLVGESRDAGTTVAFENELNADLPAATGRTVYRIVQEGLTNARKHAPGAPVTLVLAGEPGDGVRIEVRNPVPVPAAATVPGAGMGLLGLTERVQLAHGELDHGIGPDGDFRLRVRIPWPT